MAFDFVFRLTWSCQEVVSGFLGDERRVSRGHDARFRVGMVARDVAVLALLALQAAAEDAALAVHRLIVVLADFADQVQDLKKNNNDRGKLLKLDAYFVAVATKVTKRRKYCNYFGRGVTDKLDLMAAIKRRLRSPQNYGSLRSPVMQRSGLKWRIRYRVTLSALQMGSELGNATPSRKNICWVRSEMDQSNHQKIQSEVPVLRKRKTLFFCIALQDKLNVDCRPANSMLPRKMKSLRRNSGIHSAFFPFA